MADWFRALYLRPWPAALLGGAAGLVVGLAISISMARHATFTGPHQNLTAGAAVTALWVLIGVVAGLTVLSPVDDQAAGGG